MSKSWGKLGDSFDQDLNTTDNVQFAQIITALIQASGAGGITIKDSSGNTIAVIDSTGLTANPFHSDGTTTAYGDLDYKEGPVAGNNLLTVSTQGYPALLVESNQRFVDFLAGTGNAGFDFATLGQFQLATKAYASRGTVTGRTVVFSVNGSNGYVGILTTSQAQPLDVKGNIGLRKNDSIGTDTQTSVTVPGFENDVAASLLANMIIQLNSHDGLKNAFKLFLDASLNPYARIYFDSDWHQLNHETRLVAPAIAPHVNLAMEPNGSNPTYQVDASADELLVINSYGDVKRLTSFSETWDLTASGANGLDTGSEAVSTWYHLWAIYNPTTDDGTILGSESATAPTLPSGYTYKGYLGGFYNDSGGDLDPIIQINNIAFIPRTTIKSSGTDTTPTAIDLSAVVPTTAKEIFGTGGASDASAVANLFLSPVCTSGDYGYAAIRTHEASGVKAVVPWRIPIYTPQTIYYYVDSGNSANINAAGWRY